MTFRALALLSLASVASAQTGWQADQKDVHLPVRDGKWLAADVYLPAKEGKYPAVLIQTPYSKANMGSVMAAPDANLGETGRGAASDMKVLMDREHYAYVVVDWRGFYGSKAAAGGVKNPGTVRAQDGYDCVEWIAAQAWSDGKVGTWGGSALGKQQLDTAAEHPPHLVCAVPLIAVMGMSYDQYYDGGIEREGHVKRLDQLGFGVGAKVGENPLSGTPFWNYVERLTYRPSAIRVPCLLITGWWDHYPDQIAKMFDDITANGGEAARSGSRLMIGPWDHVGVGVAQQGDMNFEKAAQESGRAAKAFFDYWLRDQKDNGWDRTPRVRYWVVNEQEWRSAESWTGLAREKRTFWLSPDRKILDAQPQKPKPRNWDFDPKDPAPTLGGANLPPMKHGPTDQSALLSRTDGLWYSTGKLAKPLRVNGNVELTFTFAVDRVDCDFTVLLCDTGPDGKVILITDTARRAKLRDSTAEAKLLTPEERYEITLRFPATATTFPEGHELQIFLSNSNWPRYERNTGDGSDHFDAKAAVPANVTVFHDNARLVIPVLKE